MGIGLDALDCLRLTRLAAPDLDPSQIKSLGAGEILDHGCFMTCQRYPVSLVRDGEARVVADVLAQGQRAIDVVAGNGLVSVVLRDQRLGFLRELVMLCFGA